MIEAYQVGVNLVMNSNITAALDRVIKQMTDLEKLIKSASDAMKAMAPDVGAITRAISSTEKLGAVMRDNAKLARETAEAMAMASRAGANGARRAAPAFGGHDLMLTGIGAGIVGGGLTSFYAAALKAGMDAAHLKAIMGADDRVTQEQIARAGEQARAVTKSVPGSTIAGNLGLALDLKQVTGNLDEALAALPQFAKLVTTLEAIDRRSGGSGDAGFAAAKAVEILGRMTVEDPAHPGQHIIDPAELARNVALITQVAVGTNGRVDPATYLAFAKQARVGGMALNDQALFRDLPALFMVQGGSRAGTGEASTYSQFIDGKMTEVTAKMLKTFGILDGKAVWKNGRVQDMPKHLKGGDEFAANPVEWVRKVLKPQLEKLGIVDPVKQAQAVSEMAGRQTTAGFLGEIVRALAALDKEAANMAHTRQDSFEMLQANDPSQAMRNFDAAWRNLLTTLGESATGDAAAVLKRFTEALNAVSDWAAKNPGIATKMIDVAAGLGAIATAVGGLATAVFLFGPALKLLKGTPAAGLAPEAAVGTGAVASQLGLRALAAELVGPLAVAAAIALAAYRAGSDEHFKTVGPEAEEALRRAREISKNPFGFGEPVDGYDAQGNPVPAGGRSRGPRRSDAGTEANPLHVLVANPGDVGNAAAGGTMRRLEQGLSRPRTGPVAHDYRIDPFVNSVP